MHSTLRSAWDVPAGGVGLEVQYQVSIWDYFQFRLLFNIEPGLAEL